MTRTVLVAFACLCPLLLTASPGCGDDDDGAVDLDTDADTDNDTDSDADTDTDTDTDADSDSDADPCAGNPDVSSLGCVIFPGTTVPEGLLAQSFVPGIEEITAVSAMLVEPGSEHLPWELELRADEDGSPAGEPLAGGEIDVPLFTGYPEFSCVGFEAAVPVTPDATYWIVAVAPTDTGDGADGVGWCGNFSEDPESSNDPYPDGAPMASNNGGDSWWDVTGSFAGDFSFEVYDD